MVYAPRKLVFPIFVVVFTLTFFAILYLAFFNQSLTISDSSVSVEGDNIVIRMHIDNNTNHFVNGIVVAIRNSAGSSNYFIKDAENPFDSNLAPWEDYNYEKKLPLSSALNYYVTVSAAFNKAQTINFEVEQETIDPVRAEVSLPSKLYLNEKHTYPIKLCNISGSDLAEVIWFEVANEGDFKESFFQRGIPLKVSECKTIYSTLTPNRTGQIQIGFVLKVGSLEKNTSKTFEVVEKS
jgi:hypothetical protein